MKMLRGGVFWKGQRDTRCASHGGCAPDIRSSYLSFRIAKRENRSREIRGGSWGDVAGDCRSACHDDPSEPDDRSYDLGLRLARRKP